MTGHVQDSCDIAIIGGGLAGGLTAYRLRQTRPELRILVLEEGPAPGGNHTWSLHHGDLTAAQREWLQPFIAHAWPAYDVRFPARQRRVATGYASVTSERFRAVLADSLGAAVRCGSEVARFDATGATMMDGTRVAAGCVIDARGQAASRHLDLAFQKFLGQEVELAAPHGLDLPIVMDATVPQAEGYRFIYVLPLGEMRLLVEDTYYAEGDALDPVALRGRVGDYLEARGWRARRILREESGVLPIALGGDMQAFWSEKAGVPAIGLAAALFHPTTGYSLPDAVRLADAIAAAPDLSAAAVFALTQRHAIEAWRRRGFFRLLNRLLFFASRPAERYRILEHFYRLPDALISRFYAGSLRPADRLRILSGKPPVPLAGAMRVLAGMTGKGGRA